MSFSFNLKIDMSTPNELVDETEQEVDDDEVFEIFGDHGENLKGKESSTTGAVKKRKRMLTSVVWNFFDILPVDKDGKEHCKCKGCGKVYVSTSRYGTGNMKKHIPMCPRIDTKDIKQLMLDQSSGSLSTRSRTFDQTKYRELLVNSVIKHDLPLSYVEYEGVRATHSYLEPDVTHISRNTCKLDIKKMHADYIAKITFQLKVCPGRVCLTSDCWTSIATDGYLSLTAHYIDKNWVLQKKILNFSYMPPPHSGIALAEKIYSLVASWGIERKLFTLTLDNASANNSCVELLKNQLNLQNCLVDSGSFFHVKCCAHILNLIVKEGLKEVDVSIEKVRECVKYVKGSPSRKKKFVECVVHTFLDSKRSLKQDVPTRWNSTYLMISSALYYRLAFCHLELSDSNFKHNPSREEWEKLEKICAFLELFYDATTVFSSVRIPTSNLYFPEVFTIQLRLIEEMDSYDAYMKKIATDMYSKFDKYWKEYSPLLAIAVVFDPRYKLHFVEFSYRKLYGSDGMLEAAKFKSKLFSIFESYKSSSGSSSSMASLPNTCSRRENEIPIPTSTKRKGKEFLQVISFPYLTLFTCLILFIIVIMLYISCFS